MATPAGLQSAAPVGTCDNLMFDARTGLFNDIDEEKDRDRQNVENGAYALHNFRDIKSCGRDAMRLALTHPNLRYKNGYGNLSQCNVEKDSLVRLRGPKSTNIRGRQPLSTRVAVAGPNLARSLTSPDIESELLHSSDERQHIAYKGIPGAGADNQLTPLLPIVRQALDVKHIVPCWTFSDTRAIVRDADFARRSCARR